MSILRVNKIAASGQTSENTGSVFFDGTGDFLRNQGNGSGGSTNFSDFDFGSNDFTIEGFFYSNDITSGMPTALAQVIVANNGDISWRFRYSSNKIDVKSFNGTSEIGVVQSGTISSDTWYHVAYVREGSTFTLYIDGIAVDSDTSSDSINFESFWNLNIGNGFGSNHFTGFISNLRLVKGKALYTSNFTPPTRELEVTPETVLVACHDGENIFAEKTGKIIAAYGDRLSSPTPTATDSPIGITTFQPGLTRSVDATAGPVLQGNLEYNSQNFLVLPKGTTTERFPDFATNAISGARGLTGGGIDPSTNSDVIDYVTIATLGNAIDFGDLTDPRRNLSSVSSSTRGLWASGLNPAFVTTIDFVTIASTGDATNFGDVSVARYGLSGCSNSTRGLFIAGEVPAGSVNTIDYITLSTSGTAQDFGDTIVTGRYRASFASPTRGVNGGGLVSPTNVNTIDYITIASTGNAQDFGDLTSATSQTAPCSNSTRGVWGGGGPTNVNTISFVTISSMSNAIDFGDLTEARHLASSFSSSTRGVFAGGYIPSSPNRVKTIDYISIPTTGNAIDFGEATIFRHSAAGCSNGHGGLG